MKRKDFKISITIALIYWIPSSITLLNIIKSSGTFFPSWLNSILFPGYFLGFALGFGGGNLWAFIGQLISLIILFFISRLIYEPFKRK